MAVTAGAVVPLDEKRRRRHDLLAELREVDHWRRLVAARLDLAVAAVTAIDEPTHLGPDHLGPDAGPPLPAGLRDILGLPACDQALPEAAMLLRLRAAQRDLDEYAGALRTATDVATMELSAMIDAARPLRRAGRWTRDGRVRHLQSVGETGSQAGPTVPGKAARSMDRTP